MDLVEQLQDEVDVDLGVVKAVVVDVEQLLVLGVQTGRLLHQQRLVLPEGSRHHVPDKPKNNIVPGMYVNPGICVLYCQERTDVWVHVYGNIHDYLLMVTMYSLVPLVFQFLSGDQFLIELCNMISITIITIVTYL